MSIYNFSIQIDEKIKPYNDTISKGRARIFYKGLNRNGSYITDEFADILEKSLKYTPICGIWKKEEKDFTDHGESREEAIAYGVVPEEYNFAWENHLDEDGVERTYACADVLLWTARYEAARNIIGKGLSMELYRPSIKGEWITVDNVKAFKFTDGCFLGLTSLGDDVEPCFEGAEFYSLKSSYKDLIESLKNFNLITAQTIKQEANKMVNFMLSSREKHEKLWDLINIDYNRDDPNSAPKYYIEDVYDTFAVIWEVKENKYYYQYYTVDSDDNVILGDIYEVFPVYVNESELAVLNRIREIRENGLEQLDEDYENKIIQIETLTKEVEDVKSELEMSKEQYIALENEKNEITGECNSLKEWKKEIINSQKNEVLNKYSLKLDEKTIENYTNNLDNYTLEELNKELALAYVNATPDIFSKKEEQLIPNNNNEDYSNLSPAARVLKRHRDIKDGGKN